MIKTIRISSRHRFLEPWLTTGIETSSRTCRKLYKKSLMKGALPETIQCYKAYRNIPNRMKRKAKIDYYNTKCKEYCNNTRLLWRLINQTLNKAKRAGSIIPYITINGLQTFQLHQIAREFGAHYSSIGAKLASTIP